MTQTPICQELSEMSENSVPRPSYVHSKCRRNAMRIQASVPSVRGVQ